MQSNVAILQEQIAEAGVRHRTASGFIVEVLRRAILSGALTEGAPLRQDHIAAAFEVSRMPVREALRLLESEGWVLFHAHRGAVVAPLDPAEIEELFALRAALEGLALRRSIPKLDRRTLDRAATHLESAEAAEGEAAMAQHRAFHLALYSGCGPRLLGLIEQQLAAAERFLRIERATMDVAEEDRTEHRTLLAACRAGDIEAAVAVLGPHILEAGQELAEVVAKRRVRAHD